MEREQPQAGVRIDIALTDLDESSTVGQQFEAGTLRRAGQGIQHDVDPVAVCVAADQLGEVGTARVVDVFNAHAVQQSSTLRAAGCREDLRTGRASDRQCGLSYAAGRGVNQHPLAGRDSRLIM